MDGVATATPAADDVARRFSQVMGRASAGEVSAQQLQELTDAAAAALPSFTADHVSIVLLSLAHLAHDPGAPSVRTRVARYQPPRRGESAS